MVDLIRRTSRRRFVVRAMLVSVSAIVSACQDGTANPTEPVVTARPVSALGDIVVNGQTALQTLVRLDKCLTVQGSIVEGSLTVIAPCDGRQAQQFVFTASGEFRIGSSLCLDAFSGQGNNGDAIGIWTCHGGANQRWRITDAKEIRGVRDKCIDVYAGVANDGQSIVLWTCHGGTNQQWTGTTSLTDLKLSPGTWDAVSPADSGG